MQISKTITTPRAEIKHLRNDPSSKADTQCLRVQVRARPHHLSRAEIQTLYAEGRELALVHI